MKISEILISYLDSHPSFLSENYQTQLRNSLSVFKSYLGREPLVGDLSPQQVNRWLVHLQTQGRSPKTIKHRRNSILVLWKHAFEDLLVTDVPPRAKRVKLEPKVPQSWDHEQLKTLLSTMLDDESLMQNRIKRGLWFSSLSLGLFSTGLRLSDLLKAKGSEIGPEGLYEVIQSKTGRLIRRKIHPLALGLIKMTGNNPREYLWDLPYNRTWVYKWFKVYVQKAGLPAGTTRWIRRTAATEVCRAEGMESARKFLDHQSLHTLVNHYLSETDSRDHSGPTL